MLSPLVYAMEQAIVSWIPEIEARKSRSVRRSRKGWIEVKWERISEESYKLHVKVPFDTTAVICLPAGNADFGELAAGECDLTVTAAEYNSRHVCACRYSLIGTLRYCKGVMLAFSLKIRQK